jgi:dTDP-glucose 4,6-dehydratase
MILVTGGAGFIGANFIKEWLRHTSESLINLDKLTYAGNLANLADCAEDSRYQFVQGDICNRELVREILEESQPRAIINFAAESHVDRSIHAPENFIQTNIVGTYSLLEEALIYWRELPPEEKEQFRFLHISTDEVYGALSAEDPPFTESSPYLPTNPYSASKASADHLVQAYGKTYQLPVLITKSSNNFGPLQFPEKFIPHAILQALDGKPIHLYGDGLQVRNWIYVLEHCQALRLVLEKGKKGDSYNISSQTELTNLELAHHICALLDELLPNSAFRPHASLIVHVTDRPGHDRRYALNASKALRELGWSSLGNFVEDLRTTVKWYLAHPEWIENILSGDYHNWVQKHYKGS